MNQPFSFEITAQIIRLAGEIDSLTAPDLLAAIRRAHCDRAGALVCDTSGVTFFSAAGIGALIRGRNELHADNVTLHLVNPSHCVTRLFTLTGLTGLLTSSEGFSRAA